MRTLRILVDNGALSAGYHIVTSTGARYVIDEISEVIRGREIINTCADCYGEKQVLSWELCASVIVIVT